MKKTLFKNSALLQYKAKGRIAIKEQRFTELPGCWSLTAK